MSDRRLAFIWSPALAELSYPPDCPFNTARVPRTRELLRSFGLLQDEVAPRAASRAELEKFHTGRYLDELERAATGELRVEGLHMGLGTPETPVFKDLYAYATSAAGATLTGADLILDDKADIVFSAWGGFHHAFPERASGFCYINDIVLACQHLAAHGKRVLCLDVDAHHGDGTEAAFYARRDVLTISMHESGKTLYPWCGFETEIGEGEGHGYNVNIPLPAESYDDIYYSAFDKIVVPLIGAYRPDVIVMELGMDALAGDPLTHLRLTNNAYADVLRRLRRFNIPMLVAGGGGYHVRNTVRGWALAWKTLCGEDEHDLSIGMGGMLIANTEWAGGMRDHVLPMHPEVRAVVEPAVHETIARLQQTVFPIHGLPAAS